MKRKKAKSKTWSEIFMSERKDWGVINPVTKVIEDKRRKEPRHKKNVRDYEDD